jgi:hypothetical protein
VQKSSKKKNNILMLGGEEFKRKNNIYYSYYYNNFKSLNQCYDRPSYSKVNVYNKYYDLLLKNADSVLEYGVRSYNTFMITLEAIIKKNNKKYYLMITPSYNYFMEI